MRIGLALATAATALAFATAAPAETFYVTTGQAGGVFSLDAGDTRVWTISPLPTHSAFGGGIFVMKRGAGISVGITLALHEDTGTLLAAVSYPDSSFVGQDFVQINMLREFTFPVSQSTNYEIRLTVDAGTQLGGEDRYFIQGDTDTLTLENTVPEEVILETTSTPEPASALLLAAGVLGLGVVRRQQQATRAAG